MRNLDITEIVRKTESGITQPFQCRLSDGNLYAVKGRRATSRGLASEVISAMLGQAIGLPIPDFAICTIDPILLGYTDDPDARSNFCKGPFFASQWIEPSEVFGLSMIPRVGHHCLAQLFVFDHWIKNGDRNLTRNGGNVNLLLSLNDNRLVAFDHNLAFCESHSLAELDGHVGRGSWIRMRNVPGFKDALADRMFNAHASLPGYVDALPEEWLEECGSISAELDEALARAHSDDFWNELA